MLSPAHHLLRMLQVRKQRASRLSGEETSVSQTQTRMRSLLFVVLCVLRLMTDMHSRLTGDSKLPLDVNLRMCALFMSTCRPCDRLVTHDDQELFPDQGHFAEHTVKTRHYHVTSCGSLTDSQGNMLLNSINELCNL